MSDSVFVLPGCTLLLLILGSLGAPYALLGAITLGLIKILGESYESIRNGRYSLDYIAFLAMLVSLYSGEYLAGALIALMFTGGEALEAFASERAHTALRALGDTIPKHCIVRQGSSFAEVPIQEVQNGTSILIKRNEIVPLDGTLQSEEDAVFNMSNLTGEADAVTLKHGTLIKSGAVNVGASIELSVVGDFSSSTYHRIVLLVEDAKAHPARMVRLSEQANFSFTVFSLAIALATYFATGSVEHFLAVLVVATPCPLIIAAPVAFVGGMSRAARAGILFRKPSAFEGIARGTTVFFDKTGTLTLGAPKLGEIELVAKEQTVLRSEDALAIAAAIEMHSLHPLARALVAEARVRGVAHGVAENVRETVGKGIFATVDGVEYFLGQSHVADGGISLSLNGGEGEIARFHFADELKEGTAELLKTLRAEGVKTVVLTGDREENAERVFRGMELEVYAEQSPEDKYEAVKAAQEGGHTVVMVGDGLNDAPALARADVGIVFSGTENGASIEAADVVVLGHGIDKLFEIFALSRKTVRVARESIYGGIFLSVIAMIVAAFGYITPVNGAFLQEAIDVVVVLNALRTLTS